MTTPLRIAVIGAGAFGRQHIERLTKEKLCALAGLADPAPAARDVAASLGVPWRADAADLLDAVKPDGVIVATPNALHVPVGLACVARKLPMLVEKPIAETVAGARELVDAAERAGVTLMVGHHRRYNPIIARARAIVQEGRLGRLTAVTALWLVKKPDPYFETAWRREKGGGPILINLIHDIDDLRFIAGEITEVSAFTANAARGFPVEDSAAIALRFAGGAIGTITVSDAVAAPWNWEIASGEYAMYAHEDENCYLFAGTEGALAVPRMELWRYPGERGWTSPLARERIMLEPVDPQVAQLRHFCRVIGGTEAPLITGADAARTLAATLAVRRSAETGRAVALDGPDPA
ncbi:MAG: Gfo/Idh/MocA family oxidoreductase [Alphaproteobacteria bacterium]|nr:Gfo/Idh/MocA family oxidoreductase [Alphaproteobacteria bacterium]